MKILDKFIFRTLLILLIIYFVNTRIPNSDYLSLFNLFLFIDLIIVTIIYIFSYFQVRNIKNEIRKYIILINNIIDYYSIQNSEKYEQIINAEILYLHNFMMNFEYREDLKREIKMLESVKTEFLLKKITIYI